MKYIDMKDTPSWVQGLYPKMRKAVILEIVDEVHMSGPGHDAYTDTWYAYKDGQVIELATVSTQNPFQRGLEKEIANGSRTIRMGQGKMILRRRGWSKTLCLYVHPADMSLLITDQQVQLSKDELTVLTATKMCKSKGRFSEAHYYTGISALDYDVAKKSLIVGGFLTKRGAITTKGKNNALDQLVKS